MKSSYSLSDVIAAIVVYSLVVLLIVFVIGISVKTSKNPTDWQKEQEQKLEAKLKYNLVHPEIVGTNEQGEVIKRYAIPFSTWQTHFVYEIGVTKTTNIDLGKAGQDVIVEKR